MNSQKANRRAIGLQAQISYGSGQIAGQIYRDIPSLLLLFFATNVLGISPVIAGTAIFLPKFLVGASGDIAVGILVDRHRERIPLYWWLLFGAITAPISLIALFNVPAFSVWGQVGYVVAIVCVYMLVFASFSVPYLAIASVLASTPHQRTILMAWRLVFTAFGILIAGGLAPAFISYAGGDAAAYSQMSVLLAVFCFVSLVIAFFGSRKAIQSDPAQMNQYVRQTTSFREMFFAVRSPEFSILLLVNTLQLAGTGMSYAAMLYFLTYVMALSDPLTAIGPIIFATTFGIIAAQPFWVWLANRIGKKSVYITGTAVHAVALLLWAATATQFGLTGAILFSVLIGIGNSGWVMLGFSMLTDLSENGNAGLFSSVWIAADKVGFALGGTLLIGVILSSFGFDASKAVAGVAQSERAIAGVVTVFAIVPALFYILGALAMGKWRADTGTPD